ncbi:amino acid permease [Pandoraea terrae]|uniref:Amino acid permease n=1 Tax=Pandoraea terrae TaxID=1537710 RepID=A0A5E4RYJ9_9BURK|nr:APC family permease [Pandoraea terrae]VVD68526.1 amino acid permease [Pandoraea terrae]
MKTNVQTGLKSGALGLSESVIMGVAGTAPAFSIAATTATLIAAVGNLSPASLLYCGLIMFGVTFAYMHLNRLNPNAGASYAWVGAIFHPVLGFLAGWALLVASAVFMVSGTIPAATATLTLFSPELASEPTAVTAVAAGWLLLVSAVIVKGIKPTSYSQIVMTGIEVAVLVAVVLVAFIKYGAHPAHAFSLALFSPASFTPQLFATGALTALFFFWGWDVTVNLNEETRDSARAPGLGALLAMLIVLALFMGFAAVTLLVLTDQEIQQSSTNVVFAVANKLFPKPWSYVAIIAVMLSTVGTLETSILQFTRTMYAKGRDGTLHPRYAVLHKTWQTPWIATAVITSLGLVFLFLSSYFSSVNEIIKDSVNAIGFQVAFYYGLAGFACAWHFRRDALKSPFNMVVLMLWPVLSAVFLWFIAIYSVPTFDLTTNVVGLGGIAAGAVPLLLNRRKALRQHA